MVSNTSMPPPPDGASKMCACPSAKAGTHTPCPCDLLRRLLQLSVQQFPPVIMGPCVRRDDSRRQRLLLPLARKFLHCRAKLFGVHGIDDLLFFGIELLPGRGNRSLVDQRFGAADCS